MVKAKKFLRKPADKAELMARSSKDVELAQDFANLARAYRSQAAVLKAKKKLIPVTHQHHAWAFAACWSNRVPCSPSDLLAAPSGSICRPVHDHQTLGLCRG